MDLKGNLVFVTGASAGIGAATALAFAAEGARLLLAARRSGKLAEVASEALARGASAVHSVHLDVRNRTAVQRTIDELPEEWAQIDVLVNNAGLSRGLDRLYTGKIEDWEEMIDTNVKGLLYVSRSVVPGMVVRGHGHVVNLGSTAGELAYPNGAVYCGSRCRLAMWRAIRRWKRWPGSCSRRNPRSFLILLLMRPMRLSRSGRPVR